LVKDLPVEIRGANGVSTTTDARVETPVEAEVLPPAAPERAFTLTLGAALDFVFEQLKTGEEPIMARIEREMVTRTLAAEGGDETKAAKRLGLTKTVLQKKSKEN
jgi:transcriptional regulator with PAS, ATPase and Fis domain